MSDDAVVVDEPAVDKRPTRPNPPLAKPDDHEYVVIDFAEPEAAARFLEACARAIREQSQVVLMVKSRAAVRTQREEASDPRPQ